ncbi:hypothetical protein HDU78_008531 [Chytriomyces hyalinus]|nr:hypothetical protein HDU78_008531 [Chytriomyces hyalinus]
MEELPSALRRQLLGCFRGHGGLLPRLQDVPLEIIIHIFAWIPVRTVLKYRRLSKAINQCLMTAQFAVLNIQTVDTQKKSSQIGFDQIWFYLPEPYQTVVASTISGQIKSIQRYFTPIETKGLPESITRLTAVEEIELPVCRLVGNIPDGIGSLQNLTHLDLAKNSLTGTLPSSLSVLFALETLDLSNNELSGEFPLCPTCMRSKLSLYPETVSQEPFPQYLAILKV